MAGEHAQEHAIPQHIVMIERRAGMADTKIGAGPKDDPANVARQAVEAMLTGQNHAVVGSVKTKVQAAALENVLPEQTKANIHRSRAEPGSARPGA